MPSRNRLNRIATLSLFSLVLWSLAGCGDDDDITGPGDGGNTGAAPRDLSLRLRGMAPHVGQLVEIRVVDGAAPRGSQGRDLVSRIILDPLPAAEFLVNLPRGVPDGAHTLDFFADLNGNGLYDAPPTDHAWRISLAASGQLSPDFTHNVTFTDIEDPAPSQAGDFTLELSGMNPHVGQMFELRVIEKSSGQTVGQYRTAAVRQPDFAVVIPGIIEDGADYRVDSYADLDQDGGYDAPPTDHAWRSEATGTVDGLALTFSHNVTFTDIGFTDGGGEVEPVTFTEIQNEILTPRCVNAGCHPGGGAPMSLQDGVARGNMVDVPSGWGMDRVEPGDSSASALYLKVIGSSIGSRMPLGRPPLSPGETAMIREWIDAGAPDN